MRRKLLIAFGIVLLLIIGIAIAILFIPLDSYKGVIEEKATAAIGRRVSIKGPISLTIFPMLGVSIEGLEVDNLSGATDPKFATVKQAKAFVAIWPLLSKHVEVSSVSVEQPRIFLEKMPDGRENWAFDLKKSEGESTFKVAISSAKMSEGYLSYRSGNEKHDVSVDSAKVTLSELSGPYELQAALVAMKIPLEIEAKIGALADKIPLELNVSSGDTVVHATNVIWDRVAMQFSGKANVDFDPALVKKLKPDLTLPKLLSEPFKAQSDFAATVDSVSLNNLSLELKGQKLKGSLSASWKDAMAIKADLQGLPGQSKLALDASQAEKRWVGKANANIPALIPLLKWIEVDSGSIPAKLTKDIVISTNFNVDGEARLRDLDLSIGGARVKGDVSYLKTKEGHKSVFSLSTPNADQILILAGRELDVKIGEASLSGNVLGDEKHLRVDMKPSFGASEIQVNGDLFDLSNKMRFDIGLGLKTSRLSALMKIAGTSLPGQFENANINGRLKGNSEAVDVDVKGQIEELALAVKGPISDLKANPKLDLKIDASSPSLRGLMARLNNSATVPEGPFSGSLRLQGNLKNITGSDLKLAVGSKLNASGSFAINREKEKPQIKATLTTSALELDSEPKSTSATNAGSGSPWSTEPMDLSFLQKLNADIEINAPKAKRDDIEIQNLRVVTKINDGMLTVAPMSGTIFGGALNLNATLSSKNAATLKVDLKNANIRNLAAQGSRLKMVDGQLSFNADLATQGKSVRDLMSGLGGKAGFTSSNGKINGLDLNAIAKQIGSFKDWSSVLGLLRTSLNGGQTEFKTYGGDISFERGVGSIRTMSLSADAIEANIKGAIDLANYKLDSKVDLQLTQYKDWPMIGLRLIGPIDSPQRELDTSAIQGYLVKNVFSNVLQNVISGRAGEVKNPGDIVNKVFGKPPAAPTDPNKKPADKKAPNLLDLMKQIPKR